MWFLIVVTIICAILAINRIRNCNHRIESLYRGRRVVEWIEMESNHRVLDHVVEIDFGYGMEVWALYSADESIDIESRTFQCGVVIRPRPERKALIDYCESHGVILVQKRVKF